MIDLIQDTHNQDGEVGGSGVTSPIDNSYLPYCSNDTNKKSRWKGAHFNSTEYYFSNGNSFSKVRKMIDGIRKKVGAKFTKEKKKGL